MFVRWWLPWWSYIKLDNSGAVSTQNTGHENREDWSKNNIVMQVLVRKCGPSSCLHAKQKWLLYTLKKNKNNTHSKCRTRFIFNFDDILSLWNKIQAIVFHKEMNRLFLENWIWTRVFFTWTRPNTLKWKCHYCVQIFITNCTEICQNDNFQCSQLWKCNLF